jgi:hypothetical protein
MLGLLDILTTKSVQKKDKLAWLKVLNEVLELIGQYTESQKVV